MKSILAVFILLAVCVVPVGAGDSRSILNKPMRVCDGFGEHPADDPRCFNMSPDEPVTNNSSAVPLDKCLAIMEQAMREMDPYLPSKVMHQALDMAIQIVRGATADNFDTRQILQNHARVELHWQDAKRCWRKP